MVIPDTLSWFSPQPGPDLPLDMTIHHPCIMLDCKEAFQQVFVNNPEMRALTNLIFTGWPKDIKEVPHPLCPYWQHRETLTVEDGLVLWGEALIIPPAKRERVLHQLNQSEAAKSQANKCSKTLVPLYAGKPVAMYNTLRKIWVPATVIHVLPQNSYQVHTSNGSTYCCMWRHLCECSVKAVNTVPSGTTSTL